MGIPLQNIDNQGFTILELMVTVAIAGILVSVAMPSFTESIIGNRLTTYNNELVGALNLARSEAIKRNQQVIVARTGATWNLGWRVYVDVDRTAGNDDTFNDNGDASLCESTEDCVLRIYPTLPTGYTINTNSFGTFIRYTPSGQANLVGAFAICENNDTNGSKEINILATGRARLSGGTTCTPV
jgi:type IV fimbrial biogenesis protein FimT